MAPGPSGCTTLETASRHGLPHRSSRQTRPPYGGFRWWFTCPLVVNGRECGRRVARLHLGGKYSVVGCVTGSRTSRPRKAHPRRANVRDARPDDSREPVLLDKQCDECGVNSYDEAYGLRKPYRTVLNGHPRTASNFSVDSAPKKCIVSRWDQVTHRDIYSRCPDFTPPGE